MKNPKQNAARTLALLKIAFALKPIATMLLIAMHVITHSVMAQCSTAPTAISGPTSLCYGTGGTTITATGGIMSNSGQYQWGTGSVAGSNVIPGVTSTLYINPMATTTYWVRRMDWWPCSGTTDAAFLTVTVGSISTAPTSINSSTSICHAGNTVLTAIGGTPGTGSIYEWGTGYAVGNNIISEETGPSITVNPSEGTAYWVRRKDPAPCNRTTGGPTITLSVPSTAPTSISGPGTLCYTEGGAFLYAHGGVAGTNSQYEWGYGTTVGDNIITSSTINSLYINPMAPTDYWVRRKDPAPCSNVTSGVSFHVDAATVSGSPTGIAGITTICRGTSTTLTATGGTVGSTCYYQWGTGWTIGEDIIAGENAESITVSPLSTTVYWVRRIDPAPCNRQTYGPTVTVTVPLAVTYSASGWSAPPSYATPVVVSANLDITSNLKVCSCDVTGNATLTVHPNATLTVIRDVTVANTASMVIEDDGSLVQVDDTGTFTGVLSAKRNASPMKAYDYTYWCSPVSGWRLNQLSPLTMSDKYYHFDPVLNNWSSVAGGNAIMQRGKGYIVRAPQGWSLTNAAAGVFQGVFTGNAHTGTIGVVLQKAASGLNLIGNPYPCAIDIDTFLLEASNANMVNGTVYLWTHNTAISSLIPGNNVYNYTADDYAKYNLTGGVRSASAAISGGTLPDGKIASGQGFFIEVNSALPAGNYTVQFNNSMRVEGNNAAFYKQSQTANATRIVPAAGTTGKNRFWLNLTNTQGAFSQILVGYIPQATNGFDPLFDGKILPTANPLTLYTISGTDQYAIEGRALPFDASEVLPIGFKSTLAGSFSFSLDQTDGLFGAHPIYLRDKFTQTTINLKNQTYVFVTGVGTFNDRFELVFDAGVNTNKLTDDAASATVVFGSREQLEAVSTMPISSVAVFDLSGRRLGLWEQIRQTSFRTQTPGATGTVLLVRVGLENGQVSTQKIVLE